MPRDLRLPMARCGLGLVLVLSISARIAWYLTQYGLDVLDQVNMCFWSKLTYNQLFLCWEYDRLVAQLTTNRLLCSRSFAVTSTTTNNCNCHRTLSGNSHINQHTQERPHVNVVTCYHNTIAMSNCRLQRQVS